MPPKKRMPDIDILTPVRQVFETLPDDDERRDWMEMILDESRPGGHLTVHMESGELCRAHPEINNYYVGVQSGKVYQRNAKTKKLRKNPVAIWSHKIRDKSTLTEKRCLYKSPLLMSLQDNITKSQKTVSYIQFVADTFLDKPVEEKHYMRAHLTWKLKLCRTSRVQNIKSHFPYCPPEVLVYSSSEPTRKDNLLSYYNAIIFQEWKTKTCEGTKKIEIECSDDEEEHQFLTLGNGERLPVRTL